MIQLFRNDKLMFEFINDLFLNEKYRFLFKNINGKTYIYLNIYVVFSLLLYYYTNVYCYKIYNFILKNINSNKIYDHIIYDLLYMKQLYFVSLSKLKILEYLSLSYFYITNDINVKPEYNFILRNLKYDFYYLDNKIQCIKYTINLNDTQTLKEFLHKKYKVFIFN